jgi:hypothetical protein
VNEHSRFSQHMRQRHKVRLQYGTTTPYSVHHRWHAGSARPSGIERALAIVSLELGTTHLAMRCLESQDTRMRWVHQGRQHVGSAFDAHLVWREVTKRRPDISHGLLWIVPW